MLKVQDLTLTMNNNVLLKNINFTVQPNQIVALCGESGAGKTLTALSIMRLVQNAHYSGKILWQGKDLLSLPNRSLESIRGQEISYIFQEPSLALNPVQTIGHQLNEVFTLHGMENSAQKALRQAGFENADLGRYPHELSGGQKQRVVIAMALALSPQLIIADEPTTALDRHLQKQMISLLRHMKKNSSILLISHDISMIKYLADYLIVMKDGEIIEQGQMTDILKHPQHAYTKLLIDTDPPGFPVETKKIAQKSLPILTVDHISKVVSTGLLWKKTRKPILENISFSVMPGHTLGIIGESGAGKTTLAKIIVHIDQETSGRIFFHQTPIHGLSYKKFRPLRRKIQYIFQDPYTSLNPRMTIEEILSEGYYIMNGCMPNNIQLSDILAQVNLDQTALKRFPHQFSGGQRQRIAIARALILEPELVILDEPTSALDCSVQKNILLLLKSLQYDKGLSFIFISHDLKVVQSMCHDVVVLKNGSVIEAGLTDVVFKDPKHPYTRLLLEGGF